MFYVFHGDDAFSQQETLDSLVTRLGDPGMLELNTTVLEGRHVRMSDLRQACDAFPFLAPARLVLCKELFAKKPAKNFVDELLDYLPQLPETTRLVFLESESLPRNHRILKAAETMKNGFAKEFSTPQGGSLERWIQERVSEAGGAIEPYAAQLLAANVGGDLQAISSEVEKLVIYKGEDGPVNSHDVTLLSPYVAEANIFDLVDALGNREGEQAAALLRKKLDEGSDPFFLFAMIVRQFRLLAQVKSLVAQGIRPQAISQQLKLHSFVAGKIYQQSQHFSLDQLRHIYRRLLEIDVRVKTGQEDMITALYLLVAGVAGT